LSLFLTSTAILNKTLQSRFTAYRMPLLHHEQFDAMQQMDEKPEPDVATILAVYHTRKLATLEQACTMEYQGAQCAFKDSMIH
jgi:hypothetical protein